MSFIKSKDIKVYPSAYRGSLNDKIFNPESRLNIEENLVRYYTQMSTNTSGNKQKGSFVVDYNPDAQTIEFVVKGYYFKIFNTNNYFNQPDIGNVKCSYFVKINTVAKNPNIDTQNTDYAAISLSPVDGENADILDVQPQLGADPNFVGLDFLYGYVDGMTEEEIEEELGSTYDLKLLRGNEVPESSFIRFDMKYIDGTGDGTALNKELITGNITATNIYRTQTATSDSNIGQASDPFNKGYITNITTTSIIPTGVSKIGTSSNRFQSIYATSANLNSITSSSITNSGSITTYILNSDGSSTSRIGYDQNGTQKYFGNAYITNIKTDVLLPKTNISTIGQNTVSKRFYEGFINDIYTINLKPVNSAGTTNIGTSLDEQGQYFTNAYIDTVNSNTENVKTINVNKILPLGIDKEIGSNNVPFEKGYINKMIGSLKYLTTAPLNPNPDFDSANSQYYTQIVILKQFDADNMQTSDFKPGYLYFVRED